MTKNTINTNQKIGEEPKMQNPQFSEEDRIKVMQEIYEKNLADNGEKIIGKINKEDYQFFTKLNANYANISSQLTQNALEKDNLMSLLKNNINEMQLFEEQVYDKYELPKNKKYKIDKDMNIIVSIEDYEIYEEKD